MRLLGRSRPCRRPCALQSMELVRPSRRATEKTLFRGRASLDACGCSLDGTRCEKHRSRAPQSRTGVEEIEMFSARIESGKASDEPVMNSTGATSSTGPAVMFGLDSHGNVRSVSRPTSPADHAVEAPGPIVPAPQSPPGPPPVRLQRLQMRPSQSPAPAPTTRSRDRARS